MEEWGDKKIQCFCDNYIELDKIKFIDGVYGCPYCMMEWTKRKINTYLSERRLNKNV